MSGRRPAWIRLVALLWLACQITGIAAAERPAAGDCGCTLVTCPMHHQRARPADGARCHLVDPRQPATAPLAFLLGPVAPLRASVVTVSFDDARPARSSRAPRSLDRPSTP